MSKHILKKGDKIPFTQISNAVLSHPELSLKAKGLYAFMLSKPDDWNFTASSMASQLKEHRETLLSIMKELKNFGLLTYTKNVDGSGTYIIYHEIQAINPEKQPKSKKPTMPKNSLSRKKPPWKNSTVENFDSINNKDTSSNKEISNNTPLSPTGKKAGVQIKKSSLELPQEINSYRKKVIDSGVTGRIGMYETELKYEYVYIDSKGLLYTDTRTSKQLLSSTIKELWIQIYNEQKSIQNNNRNSTTAQKQHLSNTMVTLAQKKSL